ncbi:MAG: DUF3450 domain-containing protein [Lentisphaeria bacterium]|nr:DUF3450 domain-containing protein [Lentisphaeria bacterium]
MKIYFTFYIFVFYLGNLYANSNDLEIKKLAELIHLEKVRIEQAKLNWAYEKKQIEFQIKIAKGELNSLRDQRKLVLKKLKEIEAQYAEVNDLVSKLDQKTDAFNTELDEALLTITSFSKFIPSALKKEVDEKVSQALEALKAKNSSFKLQAYRSLALAYIELGRSTNRTQSIITLTNERIEVDIFFLGIYQGYFVSSDQKHAGIIWIDEDANEIIIPTPEYMTLFKHAIKQVDQQGEPALLYLPVEVRK